MEKEKHPRNKQLNSARAEFSCFAKIALIIPPPFPDDVEQISQTMLG